jgi:broad specificity phosphatase PhoE
VILAPTPFWFLRHGETDWNARGLSQGNVDIPLNLVGREQARRAAQALRRRGIGAVFCSPLSRARDTAHAVAAELGVPEVVDEPLREVAFGVQEGQPMSAWFDQWVEGSFTPEGAESFEALTARAVACVNRLTESRELVLIVGHGAFFRALRGAMGLPRHVRTPNALPLFCEPGSPWRLSPVEFD